eukprot:3668288-Pleurochrysis_carterae.AAC.1
MKRGRHGANRSWSIQKRAKEKRKREGRACERASEGHGARGREGERAEGRESGEGERERDSKRRSERESES